ncbi:hypothetical protein BRC67_07890 [Halobacteriales archaeon QH_3_68_24]|nr:MAG: hypothetical protein BRC67_07890 [Halobacteriales archaeon QH_3_68_24]
MVEITLFEFNVDAEELTGNAPFSGRSGSDRDDDELAGTDDGRNPKPVLVGAGLVVLVFAVVVGRRFLDGGPEPLP